MNCNSCTKRKPDLIIKPNLHIGFTSDEIQPLPIRLRNNYFSISTPVSEDGCFLFLNKKSKVKVRIKKIEGIDIWLCLNEDKIKLSEDLYIQLDKNTNICFGYLIKDSDIEIVLDFKILIYLKD